MSRSSERVYILLLSANEGSGVTATMATLANGLVEHHDVEMISLFRFADEPTFALDPRIKQTYLKDLRRRRGSWTGRLRALRDLPHRGLESRPSALLPDNSPTSAHTDRLLERKLGSLAPGVVISNRPMLHEAAARWLPPEVTLLATEHATYPQRGRAIRDLYKTYAPRFRAIMTLTEADRAAWQEHIGDDGEVVIIPNAVPSPGSSVSSLDKPVIVAAGALIERKGFDRLIEAYAPLAEAHPEWQVLIYGKGSDRKKLRRMIEDRGLDGKVVLKGFDRNYHATITDASVYAMTSRFEAFPMVLLEAMSAGVPVVAFDCPSGPRHLITDGVDGLLVPDDDIAGYTEALARLMDDPDQRKQMGAAALETIKDYSVEAIVARWQQYFDTPA